MGSSSCFWRRWLQSKATRERKIEATGPEREVRQFAREKNIRKKCEENKYVKLQRSSVFLDDFVYCWDFLPSLLLPRRKQSVILKVLQITKIHQLTLKKEGKAGGFFYIKIGSILIDLSLILRKRKENSYITQVYNRFSYYLWPCGQVY